MSSAIRTGAIIPNSTAMEETSDECPSSGGWPPRKKAAPPRMVAIVERTRADERSLDPSLTVRATRTYGEQSRPYTLLVNAETLDLLLNGERRQGLPKMSQYCRKLRLGRLGCRLASVAHVRSRPIPLNAPMGGTVPLDFKIAPIISQLSRRAGRGQDWLKELVVSA